MAVVLLTGVSGAGKSTLIAELRRRGHHAYDADDDGFTEPRQSGEGRWKVDEVHAVFERHTDADLVFFAGCSEEQALFAFDHRVLLTAPRAVIAERLRTRTGNDYGKSPEEFRAALGYLDTVEPLLRASADAVVETMRPPSEIADQVLSLVGRLRAKTAAGGEPPGLLRTGPGRLP